MSVGALVPLILVVPLTFKAALDEMEVNTTEVASKIIKSTAVPYSRSGKKLSGLGGSGYLKKIKDGMKSPRSNTDKDEAVEGNAPDVPNKSRATDTRSDPSVQKSETAESDNNPPQVEHVSC